jgi:hypothetical protein
MEELGCMSKCRCAVNMRCVDHRREAGGAERWVGLEGLYKEGQGGPFEVSSSEVVLGL